MRVAHRDAVGSRLEQLDVVLAVSERDDPVSREAEPVGDEREA